MKTNKAIQINGRTAWIDAAKCIGILFVLMAHAQLQIPFLSDYAVYFYVPIFFVLAGFTYHAKEESYAHFCKRKARRLLLPYFGYSLFLYACFVIKDCILSRPTMTQVIQPLVGILYSRNCFYPLGSADNPTIMTIWNAPLWFLTALFLSYLLFELGMRITKRQSHRMLLYTIGCVGVGILIHDTCKILLPWSLDSVFLLESLLAFGYWLQQSKFFTKPRVQTSGYFKIAVVIVLLLLPFTMMWNGKPNLSVGEYGRSVLLGLFNMAVTSVSVLTLCYLARNQIGAGLA
ncbi:MAG: acyltransferase family protein, partial [Lachnospiraceae bacterium]